MHFNIRPIAGKKEGTEDFLSISFACFTTLFTTDKLPWLSKNSFPNGSVLIFNLGFMITNMRSINNYEKNCGLVENVLQL